MHSSTREINEDFFCSKKIWDVFLFSAKIGSGKTQKNHPMATTILQSNLSVTISEFVDSVYGKSSGACALRQTKFLLRSIVEHGTTLVSSLAKGLRPDLRTAPKKQREMISRYLNSLDLTTELLEWLSSQIRFAPDTPVGVDCSDLSKTFGGKGMEGMEWGYDGSTGGKSMGHYFVSAAIVPGAGYVAKPFWVKIQRGKHGIQNLTLEAVRKTNTLSNGLAICILDRGGDGISTLKALLDEKIPSIVRISKMDRDLFGTGRSIDEELSRKDRIHTDLRRNSGEVQQATIRWAIGDLDVSSDQGKDAVPNYKKILVVESRFKGKSLYFYRILATEEYDKPEVLRKRATQTAQLYLQRWQIETSYLRLKQDFGLEDARVRTFKRLENLFALCYLGYYFVQFYIPQCGLYHRFVKIARDNAITLTRRAESLLSAIRVLLRECMYKYITGRPRKKSSPDAFHEQMMLAL